MDIMYFRLTVVLSSSSFQWLYILGLHNSWPNNGITYNSKIHRAEVSFLNIFSIACLKSMHDFARILQAFCPEIASSFFF